MLRSARIASTVFLLVFFAPGTSSFAQDDGPTDCFLSASQSTIEVGDAISWRLTTSGLYQGAAYFGGSYSGSRYIPERIADYSGQTSWTKIYAYESAKQGTHERFIEIRGEGGNVLCRTNTVGITVKPREKVKIAGIALPIDKPKPQAAATAISAPIAEKCEATFSYSCQENKKLKASWNLGQGLGCTIYIRDGRGDHAIATTCAGSSGIDSLDGEAVSEGGNYQFFVSNGKEGGTCYNEMKGELNIGCGSQPSGSSTVSTPARQVECSLTPSRRLARVGDEEGITWTIRSSTPGVSAEWHGKNNGQDIAPAPVENYPKPGEDWHETYRYPASSEYLRFARIKDAQGNTICTTDAVNVTVTQTGELTSIDSLPGGPRTVTLTTVNGQRIDIENPRIKIDFPKLFARGDPQTVTIFVQYSDGTTDTKSVTFRNKITGVEISEENVRSAGEACDIGSVHWLKAAKNKDGPEPLFCRDVEGRTGGSNWITQKQANDWCQGQRGLTALAGDGNGGTLTFYCNGQDWVDERTWLAFQQPQPDQPQTPQQGGLPQEQDRQPPQAGGASQSLPIAPAAQVVKNPFDLCDASVGCFDTAKSPTGGSLYCRNIGSSTSEQYMWVTDDYAGQQCSTTQVGRTALCGGKTYSCDGTTWREAQPAGGAAGGAPAKTVSRVYFQTSSGQVPVAQGQQVRIPISGGATVTLVVEYSDGSSKSRALTFRPPAPRPAEPAAQTCPGQCGDSAEQGEGGTTCTGYLEGKYEPCKDNDRYPYCYTSCQ